MSLIVTRLVQLALFYSTAVLFTTCAIASPVFTESPKSVTSLPGRDVLFHCAGYQTDVPAERLHLTWIIDNQPFDQIIAAASPGITQNTVPSGNTIQSNLTIPATPGNNGTTVRCHIGEFLDEPVISNSSILTVLLGIQDCAVHTDNTSILVECTFAINSTTPGIVVIHMIQDEQSQYITNRTLQRLGGDSKGSVNITDLPAGEYRVSVFHGTKLAYAHLVIVSIAAVNANQTIQSYSQGPGPSISDTTLPPTTPHLIPIVVGITVTLFVVTNLCSSVIVIVIIYLLYKGRRCKTKSLSVNINKLQETKFKPTADEADTYDDFTDSYDVPPVPESSKVDPAQTAIVLPQTSLPGSASKDSTEKTRPTVPLLDTCAESNKPAPETGYESDTSFNFEDKRQDDRYVLGVEPGQRPQDKIFDQNSAALMSQS